MTIKLMAKICSVAAIVLLVVAALGPGNWTPRTALGWQIDHFLGYFVITSIVCIAWSRPFVVGGALMAVAALLEGLQALTPDRSSNLFAAFCGASGAQAGRWRRRCLLSSSSEHGGGGRHHDRIAARRVTGANGNGLPGRIMSASRCLGDRPDPGFPPPAALATTRSSRLSSDAIAASQPDSPVLANVSSGKNSRREVVGNARKPYRS